MRPEILQAMVRPVIGHRGQEMEELMGRIGPRLSRLFRTHRPVYISTSSATGLMEAAIRNCAPERVLALVNGAFSERFYRIAGACGRGVDRVEVAWGEANEPEAVRAALRDRSYDAVTLVHSETSTGVLNPLAEIAGVVQDVAPDTLILVDCVTSVGAVRVEVDEWGLDFALTGSQKAMALPPGLAFGAASERAYRRSLEMRDRGLYFDFEGFEAAAAKRQTSNTPAVSLLFALDEQLARIEAEGVEGRWARHRAMAERTWAWVEETRETLDLDLRVLAPEDRRSPSVTCVALPESMDGVEVTQRMGDLGYTLAPGYGQLKRRSFRIGHMGDHTLEELETLLETLTVVLEQRGRGGG